MRAVVEQINTHGASSFVATRYVSPGFPFLWHLHPEIELTLILSGRGRRLVGDSIETFGAGDLVLLGKNLPHTWSSDRRRNEKLMRHEAVVVQFHEHALGQEFFKLPEMRGVARLLEESARGIVFSGEARNAAQRELVKLVKARPAERLVMLVQILDGLARARPRERAYLASTRFTAEVDVGGERRIADVCRWVHEHFAKRLRLSEAARRAHLSMSAFHRSFKKATGRTFIHYVNEVRIAQACRLLLDTDQGVAGVALEAGFNNLSHFNRRFLRSKSMCPRAYRRAYGVAP